MTEINVGTIEVHPVSFDAGKWQVLALQRGKDTRCPGSWEVVHGRIENGEAPEDSAIRELFEEAGLRAERLYNVRVQPFYLHRIHTLELSIVFAAFVDPAIPVTLGSEHAAFEWLSFDAARKRLYWPAARTALNDIEQLFAGGDAGVAEDAMRVR